MSAALKLDLSGSTDRTLYLVPSSVPTLQEFDPNLIPYQHQVITDIRKNFDYSLGAHEVMLSGSVGSAKSLLMAHIVITHCLMNPGANALIGRKALPQLKDTLLQMIMDHIGIDITYTFNKSRGVITFPNGSKIFCYSWHDKKYKKVRSYALSLVAIEELTENDDPEFFKEIRMRLGRLPHIKENVLICATNPDSPGHWAHQYFIDSNVPTRHVYYSVTSDNPFLPESYIQQLKETLTPKEALRMLYGQWVEIKQDVIYYNYDQDRNFKKDESYHLDYKKPIDVMFDFNIANGKPMSAAIGQHDGKFRVIKDFVVEGARTRDICEDIADSGLLDHPNIHLRVFGDGTGRHRDTRSIMSDYDIIDKFFQNMKTVVTYENLVPRQNPPIRKRHNLVNAQFLNDNEEINLYVYKDAKVANQGFRFSKLLPASTLVEDDRDSWQHITTAVGYWVCSVLIIQDFSKNRSRSYMT